MNAAGSECLYAPLADGDLRLELLAEPHREGLRSACNADTEIWAIFPFNYSGENFDAQFERMLASPPRRYVYAVLAGDEVVGMTGWIEHGAPGWSIEIGNTFLAPAMRGTGLNGRMKRLMLDHAFACGLKRVAFKIDAVNARSRAAAAKLGVVEEGIMRAERLTWNGRVRDTVLLSILADEWTRRKD